MEETKNKDLQNIISSKLAMWLSLESGPWLPSTPGPTRQDQLADCSIQTQKTPTALDLVSTEVSNCHTQTWRAPVVPPWRGSAGSQSGLVAGAARRPPGTQDPTSKAAAGMEMGHSTAGQPTTNSRIKKPVKMPIQESGAFLLQPKTQERYRMQSKPLGICLIINCTGNDTEDLQRAFTSLGYKVECLSYLQAEDISQALHRMACMPQHQDYDSFVCILVSRGSSQSVFGVDQTHSGLSLDQIRRTFTGDACPYLIGKPKLFFIQNYEVLEGQLEDSSVLEVDGPAMNNVESKVLNPEPYMVHQEADIFWSLCRADVSHLEETFSSHSVYLQNLSQQLEQGRKRPLVDLHVELTNKIYDWNRRVSDKEKYHLSLQHTLRKELILSCI
ncbi:CASP8 and FADD-like apoptosis regulator isoform X3 [Dipodomys merriami]|uniref:CASP8 and FADD-like apoptosis regulator isoform X3 n=1 Tax=Dipodomys merriami TaxID=94247 RepID=UPI0038557FA9